MTFLSLNIRAMIYLDKQNGVFTMHHSIKEFAERTAINLRAQALAFDILARDMRRQIRALEEEKKNKPTKPKMPPPEKTPSLEDRLYVHVKEAKKIMGMGNTSIYKEMSKGRLPVKKSGRNTLIAIKDIHTWFENLPDK